MKKLNRLIIFCLLMVCIGVLSSETPVFQHQIVVLYTQRDPIIPDLPEHCCKWVPLESFNNRYDRAQIVIVAGHGLPPYFAGHEVHTVAKAVKTYQPELIVMNSCYGASSDIFQAFIQAGLRAQIVGAPFPIYQPGFIFEPAFAEPQRSMRERIQAIRTEPPYPLVRWRLDPERLAALQAKVDQLTPAELKERLRRVQPALVRMAFPTALEKDSEILVPVPVARFQVPQTKP